VRTREFGIRTALGAGPRKVLGMVLGDACGLAALGIAAGWAGAILLTRSLTALLFEVKPGDPRVYAAVSVLLWVIALAATWVPARRAMSVPAAEALRSE
jgi:ABC-type antimicrobial peptide transport system permease subunit